MAEEKIEENPVILLIIISVGVVLLVVASQIPLSATTTETTEYTYEMKINPNTVENIPDNAVHYNYESLNEERKEIVLEVIGSDESSLVSGDPPTYIYENNETRYAEKIASADYISKDEQYYQVLSRSSTETIETTTPNIVIVKLSKGVSYTVGIIGSIFIIGGLIGLGEHV